jgi:hypothetical protein
VLPHAGNPGKKGGLTPDLDHRILHLILSKPAIQNLSHFPEDGRKADRRLAHNDSDSANREVHFPIAERMDMRQTGVYSSL